MRTTVAIDDHLLIAAKARARARGVTLGRLIEDGLRLEAARGTQVALRPAIPVFDGGTGPRPGIDLTSNRSMLEVLDEGLSPDTLR
jgi:hypothetical protein